jgi:Uma2 family endonuclease
MPDGGKGYELVRGRLKELNVSTESSRVGGEVHFHIRTHLSRNPVGWAFPPETGFRCFRQDPTDPDRVRKPDAAFVSYATLPPARYKRDGFCEIVPDIAVEVISPNDLAREVEIKRDEWLRAGVKEVWVVSPDTETVMVYLAGGGSTLLRAADALTTTLLPGFAVPVADLFRLPPAPAGSPQAPAAAGE